MVSHPGSDLSNVRGDVLVTISDKVKATMVTELELKARLCGGKRLRKQKTGGLEE